MCNNLNLCHEDLFIKFRNLSCGMGVQDSDTHQ
jgi:hypothetical protein